MVEEKLEAWWSPVQISEWLIEAYPDDLHTFLGLAEANAGYETIKARVSIESDAAPADLETLHEKVVVTSPVGHTLQRAVPISVELT